MHIVIGLIAFSFIVFFHELGHFLFAKLFGVNVLSFSIGMGPVLLHKTVKGTDYRLSLIPFGGYCGMEGEADFQKALDTDADHIEKNPSSLYGIHPLKRAMICFAGPMFNFILAILCFTVISMVGYKYASFTNSIVIPDESTPSPAREAGLQTGDKILKINNEIITNFRDIQIQVLTRPKEVITLEVDRNGEILTFKVKTLMNKDEGYGILGIQSNSNEIEVYETKTYSFFPALYHGFLDTIDFTKQTVKSISILFKGVDATKVVSGPAKISSLLGESVTEGFEEDFRIGLYSTLSLIALINISLGFCNLLPIPVLDGGLILFAIIAIIRKKEVPPKIQIKIQYASFIIIAALLILGITSDVRYFIGKWSLK